MCDIGMELREVEFEPLPEGLPDMVIEEREGAEELENQVPAPT
jgi:hypothetical protein